MRSRCIYFVEGEDEKKLINALKLQPERVIPGQVRVHNVIQNLIPKSVLLTIKPGTIVVFVFDTDVEKADVLLKNIDRINQICSKVQMVNLCQVLKLEDELVRSSDIRDAYELTKSRSVGEFKHDFCKHKDTACRKALEDHQFDIQRMWETTPPSAFSFVQLNSRVIKR